MIIVFERRMPASQFQPAEDGWMDGCKGDGGVPLDLTLCL